MNEKLLSVFTKIPTLYTERLTLRKLAVSDADDMYEYSKRFEVSKYLLWSPHESRWATKGYLSYLQRQYAKKQFYDWAITLSDSKKMIGTIGFTAFDIENNSAEVGYVLSSDYWGKGIAAEALNKIIDFGFDRLSLHRLEARIMTENLRSKRVAEKCGFVCEAVMRDKLYVKGEYRTIDIFARINPANAQVQK